MRFSDLIFVTIVSETDMQNIVAQCKTEKKDIKQESYKYKIEAIENLLI